MIPDTDKKSPLDIPLKRWFPFNWETALVLLILLAAVVSRFYDLGARTMSHDEVNHVVPAFDFYAGRGYRYDPLSHGPLQFHMMALSYALFGDNDFTSRIPAAVLSIATVAVGLLAFRRYLGRKGALIAGFLLLISPFMLFYGRYARNEAYIVLWTILILYAVLRYLERGEAWVLVLFTVTNALQFSDKATSYMFAAQQFVFLLIYLIDRLARREWPEGQIYRRMRFLIGLLLLVVFAAGAAVVYVTYKPLDLTMKLTVGGLALAAAGALAWSIVEVVRGLGLEQLRNERSLNLLLLLGTFLLPLVSAIPISLLGYTPLDYSMQGAVRVAIAAGILGAIAVVIGLLWFGKKWLLYAALFFIPIATLYTTFFTYPDGMIGGLVGALSYWGEQHGVNRGDQPYYYYALLQIPVYEFLPAIGTIIAAILAGTKRLWQAKPGQPFTSPAAGPASDPQEHAVPTASLLVFWSVTALALFSYAGEKMPWLTIHITLSMILATAWVTAWLLETIPWGRLAAWGWRNYARAALLTFLGLLAFVTGRSAYRAAFINYDYPFEYLVYAHAAPDPKMLYRQIEEISLRTTGGTDMVVAYDNDVRYPYWWYMRRYPNRMDFDVNPTRDLRNVLLIAVSDANYVKLMPVVRENYYEQQYMRLWWPSWDYWSLKWNNLESSRNADLYPGMDPATLPEMTLREYLKYAWKLLQPFFTDRQVTSAVWQIWYNRDFTEWGEYKGSDAYSLTNWAIDNRMRFYIRKDIQSALWPFGITAAPLVEPVDPYEGLVVPASADRTIGGPGSEPGQFASPRALAVAPDGSLYVADTFNHRIQHLSPDGEVLQVWGRFASLAEGDAPGGTFNEPWGVAVGPDGSVYVADTWNYRIQKFTSDGRFLTMWGTDGQADSPVSFYGPRGVAVDDLGRVYVADTGNKRIVVFDGDGNYLSQIGMPGMDLGQFDEPVAIAIDPFGNVYVTDTWNQRVQVFAEDFSGLGFYPLAEWLVDGWYGKSVDNKPYLAVQEDGNVSVTDPELCRVITFSPDGQPVRVLDGCAGGAFQMPVAIVPDGAGGLWITDAVNNQLVHLPAQP